MLITTRKIAKRKEDIIFSFFILIFKLWVFIVLKFCKLDLFLYGNF